MTMSPISSNQSPSGSPKTQRDIDLRLSLNNRIISTNFQNITKKRLYSDDYQVPVIPKKPFGDHKTELKPEFVSVPNKITNSFYGEDLVKNIKKMHGRLVCKTDRHSNNPSPERLPVKKGRSGSEDWKNTNIF